MNLSLSNRLVIIGLLYSIVLGGINCAKSKADNHDPRPNILILVADDLGYSDLGCFGGEIETPNIDALSRSGIRFSRFHTAPMCAPTRAMLLSGNDNHIAGIGSQDTKTSEFGYEGKLTNRIATVPSILRANGYHTFLAGKWHLGNGLESNPHHQGFEHSMVLLEGAGNHYDDQGVFEESPVSPYTEDGQPTSWPKGAYSTDHYTDKLIEYIGRYHEDGKPFLGLAAYTTPHWPLQVDKSYWNKYEGQYDLGYEDLKEKRLQNLKDLKIIPKSAVLPPNHKSVQPWKNLSPGEKEREAHKMELYAGMVENLDFNVGRLINHLKEINEYDNTLIIFMGDNGAAAEDFYNDDHYGKFIKQHFNNDDVELWGTATSFVSYGPQWAEAGSAPFRYFKGYATEGGTIAPLIISGKSTSLKNGIYHNLVTVLDIAPTIYEATGIQYPETFEERAIHPLVGESILPFASGRMPLIHGPEYVFALEHRSHALVIKGDWKITNTEKPFQPENFKLYNLKSDLAELNDLKENNSSKFNELINAWVDYVEDSKVKFPTPSPE